MKPRDQIFNVLSLVMLGLTLLLVFYYIVIAVNPYSSLNFFPPPQPTVMATHTPTATPTRQAPPTWTPTTTPTVTPTPPASFTPTATFTPLPATPTTPASLTPTPTLSPSPTPRVTRSPYPFTYEITYETPFYGCAWMGVGGTVQDLDGNPLIGYPVRVWGGGIDTVVTSGGKQMYGDSGWEQYFMNQPQEVRGIFRVQLHSPDGNHSPISDVIELDFPGYCSSSLANIVFIKNH